MVKYTLTFIFYRREMPYYYHIIEIASIMCTQWKMNIMQLKEIVRPMLCSSNEFTLGKKGSHFFFWWNECQILFHSCFFLSVYLIYSWNEHLPAMKHWLDYRKLCGVKRKSFSSCTLIIIQFIFQPSLFRVHTYVLQ